MDSEAIDPWERAALLMQCGGPDQLAKALAAGHVSDPASIRAARDQLVGRGLVPRVPRDSRGAPLLLVRGAMTASRRAAIVGARASDSYGLAAAGRAAADAVSLGMSVLSGGAEGCDAAAHRAALAAGGETVVVLGSGHDRPYPAAHRGLFDNIAADGGAIVSPWWPTIPSAKHRFLRRNRVIAAMADVVIVARAAARSGALSTAREAIALGRPLMAVPGDVGEAMSVGGNRLLGRGACAMGGARDLAAACGGRGGRPWPVGHRGAPAPAAWAEAGVAVALAGSTPEASTVAEVLGGAGALDLDGLVVQTGLGVEALISALMELEVRGMVERLPGDRYRLGMGGPG